MNGKSTVGSRQSTARREEDLSSPVAVFLLRLSYVLVCLPAGGLLGCGLCALLSRWITMDGDDLLMACVGCLAIAGGVFGWTTRKGRRFRRICASLGGVFLLGGLALLLYGSVRAKGMTGWDGVGFAILAYAGAFGAVLGSAFSLIAYLAYLVRAR